MRKFCVGWVSEQLDIIGTENSPLLLALKVALASGHNASALSTLLAALDCLLPLATRWGSVPSAGPSSTLARGLQSQVPRSLHVVAHRPATIVGGAGGNIKLSTL